MPAVFVHGVPETHEVWDGVRGALARADSVALALPGFGAPVPDGWSATKEAYADWIVARLEAIGEPVDLVGHDWGSILVQRVASIRPELVRTLACGSGPADSEYTWHPLAQIWQTPGAGEEQMVAMSPELLATALAPDLGADPARRLAAPVDDAMKRCILELYRSAIDVGREWQPAVDALGTSKECMPVLVVWGRDDVYAPPEFGRRLARRLNGEFLELDCGHFWPILRPERVAAALAQLWDRA